jgi:hypothetical protein
MPGNGTLVRLRTLIIVIAAAVLLTGCWSDPAQLNALRKDPMANVDLSSSLQPAASIVGVSETPGRVVGAKSPAAISHTFTVLPGKINEALAFLADDAREAGWTLEGSDYTGAKTIDGLSAHIVITGDDTTSQVSVTISTSGS